MDEFFGLSGWLVGVASFVFAVFVYLRTRSVRKIVGKVVEHITVALPPGEPAAEWSLSGNPITKCLTSLIVEFRHSGNTSIPKSEVREFLRVRLDAEENATLRGVGLALTQFRANKTLKVDSDEKGDILIEWEYLDPGDSFRVAIFVDGKVRDVNFDAHIVGDTRVVKSIDRSETGRRALQAGFMTVYALGTGIFALTLPWNRLPWHELDLAQPVLQVLVTTVLSMAAALLTMTLLLGVLAGLVWVWRRLPRRGVWIFR